MISYDQALKNLRADYKRDLTRLKQRYGTLNTILWEVKPKELHHVCLSGWHGLIVPSISIQSGDPVRVELEIIPFLSELGADPWTKEVTDVGFDYSTVLNDISVKIFLDMSNSCKILKLPTGRTKKESQWVVLEVPEYETVVDCGG